MGVRIRHPDLPVLEVVVPADAVPHHARSGWQEVEDQAERGETWPAELQPFGGQPQIRIRHPLTGAEATVAEEARAFWLPVGWQVVEDEPEAAEPASLAEATGLRDLAADDGLDGMTVAQLQDEARARGLPVSGTKAELLSRLRTQQATSPATAAEQTSEEE